MAYSTSNRPKLVAQANGSNGHRIFTYHSDDPFTTVAGSGYFTDGDSLGMEVGDTVIVFDDTNNSTRVGFVSAVVSGGAASISGGTQELTASGAVTPGVTKLDLNHATVVIEATIADAAAHPGLFIIEDTSASGTAAHTVTLSVGTFDGSNNVATLNAPGELLAVWFDGEGRGTIIQNTGSVALS